jgi:hypothetical protein
MVNRLRKERGEIGEAGPARGVLGAAPVRAMFRPLPAMQCRFQNTARLEG